MNNADTEGRQKPKEYLQLVQKIAESVKKQINPPMETDELISLGTIGLQEALSRFDPSLGIKFETFAFYRIRGAIYDGIAKSCNLSRYMAKKLKLASRANDYMQSVSSDASAVTLSTHSAKATLLNSIVKDLTCIYGLVSVIYKKSENDETAEIEFVDDKAMKMHEQKIQSGEIHKMLQSLPPQQAEIIKLYYFEDMTLEEAAKKMGFTKGWACKLHDAAIKNLRKLIMESGG